MGTLSLARRARLGTLLALSACSAAEESRLAGAPGGADTSGSAPAAGAAAPVPDGAPAGAPAPGSAPEGAGLDVGGNGAPQGPPLQPGTLTAGVWDDNRNFDFFLAYRDALYDSQRAGLLPLTQADHRAAYERFSLPREAKQTLDVSLVIDTTGSMGDEIRYLQAEFIALSSWIFQRYPRAEQRWSLVLYRDVTDSYVVRAFDFRSDPAEFQLKLDEQFADEGGDYPEAPDQALAKLSELSWRSEPSTARVAFWVADAPHHAENAPALAAAVHALGARDVHVYPVASSGVDELTELSMRQVAQLSGGRYLFLTDDSGVGGAHKEPTIPCYFVTRLDDAIARMVDIELSGMYREPLATEVVRSSGVLQDGRCAVDSGQNVLVY